MGRGRGVGTENSKGLSCFLGTAAKPWSRTRVRVQHLQVASQEWGHSQSPRDSVPSMKVQRPLVSRWRTQPCRSRRPDFSEQPDTWFRVESLLPTVENESEVFKPTRAKGG